jgi:hypothetical protein
MIRFIGALVCVVACGGSTRASGSSAGWRPSPLADASALHVRLDPSQSWKEAARAIIGDMCPDAVLVWGDLQVDESVRPRAVEISIGDAKLNGFLVCNTYIEAFLKLQTVNPRLKAGHGGTADLKWRDGQLFMRRRWSAADIALGQLSPPPGDVFQRGETLAAIVSCEDDAVLPAELLGALARAPTVFLFGMFPLMR